MIQYLDALHEQVIDSSGWDKMGRDRPSQNWADEQIDAMTNVELLWHIDMMNEEQARKDALT